MVAKNINIVKVAQAALVKEVPLPIYSKLVAALQLATNIFVKFYFIQILRQFVKDSTTVTHILTIHKIRIDTNSITNVFTPYTNLQKLTDKYIIANN